MISFAELVAARECEPPVLVSDGGRLTRDELLATTTEPHLGSRPRLALSIRATDALIRVLSAYDGHAAALLLLSQDLTSALVTSLAAEARCTAILSDRTDIPGALHPDEALRLRTAAHPAMTETDWIMTTSGTTGRPKMVCHKLATLSRTTRMLKGDGVRPVWGLTYEATRFAGLQVVLQAVFGGGTLAVPKDLAPDLGARLVAFASVGCTHLSATPTFWRRILMHPASRALGLRQITLGGEIADQSLLDALHVRFPGALITHIFAATETGVGFSVKDGREGFPISYLEHGTGGIRLKITDGRLWIQTPADVRDYLGGPRMPRDAEGYVDTQDMVQRRGDRILFLGRESGVVNVGGAKVHPEAVERTINMMPEVALARVSSRRNLLSGAILVAQVVPSAPPMDIAELKMRVVQHCRAHLPPEAVPALVQVCDSLDVGAAGKLMRT
jgi:acyl-coenzyme A synthetase/AMP-(fatty) acid ligase